MSDRSVLDDYKFTAADWVRLVATVVFIFGLGYLVAGFNSNRGHEEMGTAAHVCFANHTCRDSMRCVTGVGMEDGVCVKEGQ